MVVLRKGRKPSKENTHTNTHFKFRSKKGGENQSVESGATQQIAVPNRAIDSKIEGVRESVTQSQSVRHKVTLNRTKEQQQPAGILLPLPLSLSIR